MKVLVCLSLVLAVCAVATASIQRASKTEAKLHGHAAVRVTTIGETRASSSHDEPALDAPERFSTSDVELVDGKLVWAHSVSAAVYTSSQIATDSNGAAFATSGTWLNAPFMADSTPSTGEGTEQWTFAPPAPVQVVYRTSSARHIDAAAVGPVDTVAAVTGADAPFETCQLYGFSAAGSNAPVWKYNISTYCYTDLVDQPMAVISDDGSTVAFLVASNHTVGGPLTVQLHVLDAQNGTLLFQYTVPASQQILMRSLAMSTDGQYILFVNDRSIYVLDKSTGQLRNGHPITQSISPVATTICQRGVFIVTGYRNVTLLQWNSTANDYTQVFTMSGVRSNGHQYVVYAVATSKNGGGGEPMGCIASVGWTRADDNAHAIAVDIFHMFSPFTVYTSWESTENTQVQNIPTQITMHMNYALVTAWGDYVQGGTSTQPTVLLFDANVPSSPIFTHVTPGSAYDGQVLITERNESGDTLVLSAAGKSTHANVMGSGGRAFSFAVTVSN